MDVIPVKVACYSGYKANESPRSFYLGTRLLEVKEVLDRWYQAEQNTESKIADYFKLLCNDGNQYLLKYDRDADLWFLVK